MGYRRRVAYHWFDVRMRHRFKHLVFELKLRSKVDVGALILGRITVLGSGENGNTASIMLNFVTLHPDLVRTDNRFESIVLTEPFRDVGTELKSNPSLARPTTRRSLGVSPQHLHHKTLLPRLSLVVAVQLPDVVQGCLIIGEKTTVEDQVLVANQGGQWQGRE